MASDFTVTWQFSQREPLFFFILDQTPRSADVHIFSHPVFLRKQQVVGILVLNTPQL
jgi:hypothetical protein